MYRHKIYNALYARSLDKLNRERNKTIGHRAIIIILVYTYLYKYELLKLLDTDFY